MINNQPLNIISFIIISDGNLFNLRLTLSSILYNTSVPYEIIITNLHEKTAAQIAAYFPENGKMINCRSINLVTNLFYTKAEAKDHAASIAKGNQLFYMESGYFLPCQQAEPLAETELISFKKMPPKTGASIQTSLVSIIIPVFNNLEYTQKAIQAIINNTTECFELIIVDNASSDNTPRFLQELSATRLSPFCRRLNIITNMTNLGFAKANNQAAEVCLGEYLLFLNNDTEVQPGWLGSLVRTLEKNPRAAVAGARLLYPDYTIQHAGVAFAQNSVQHIFQHFAFDFPPALKARNLQAVTAACMLIRREVFRAIGGFDEQYINCFEDTDLCLKAVQKDYAVIYQPDCVVVHHESKSKGRKDHEAAAGQLLGARWNSFIKPDYLAILNSAGLGFHAVDGVEVLDFIEPAEGITKLYYDGMTEYQQKNYLSAYQMLSKVNQLIGNDAPPELSLTINNIFAYQGIKREFKTQKAEQPKHYQQNLVSIIIPVFNNLEYTKDAVGAVLDQTKSAYELIIVNNNSTDGSFEYLETLKEQDLSKTACKMLKIVHNQTNRAFAAANNQAAEIAEGEFLLCLNNDTKVTAGWLENMLFCLKNQPRTAAVGAKLLYADNTIQHAGVVSTKDCDIPFHFMQHANSNHAAVCSTKKFFAVTAACVLIDHFCFDLAGGYHEEFINCFEDIDLCYKFGDLGLDIYYEPSAEVYHFESKTKGRRDNVAHSAKILRELWQEKMPDDADNHYQDYNLSCVINNQTRSIIIDFTDISTAERIKKANQLFVAAQYCKVTDLLWAVYQLSPEKQPEIVYQLLALSLEFSDNLEKAREVLQRLCKKFPAADNQQLMKIFGGKYRGDSV